jgi:hypothetical protein
VVSNHPIFDGASTYHIPCDLANDVGVPITVVNVAGTDVGNNGSGIRQLCILTAQRSHGLGHNNVQCSRNLGIAFSTKPDTYPVLTTQEWERLDEWLDRAGERICEGEGRQHVTKKSYDFYRNNNGRVNANGELLFTGNLKYLYRWSSNARDLILQASAGEQEEEVPGEVNSDDGDLEPGS